MANRIPLIVNPTSSQIQELPTGDVLFIPNTVDVNGSVDISTALTLSSSATTQTRFAVSATTASTNTTTGCATFAGGVGIGGAVNVGGNITATNFIKADGTPIASNAPTFKAKLSADQAISPNVGNSVNTVKVQFDSEEIDSDNRYNNTGSTDNGIPAYSFKPDVAGTYFVSASTSVESSGHEVTFARVQIYKNSDVISACVTETDTTTSGGDKEFTQTTSTIIQMNGTSDTLHVQTDATTDGTGTLKLNHTTFRNYFFAYKLIL